jgi:hypothetical protein
MSLCFDCFDQGLKAFIQSREHRISEVTARTYQGDGNRFSRFFYEGSMKVKGNWVRTQARGASGYLSLNDIDEFVSALVEGKMPESSANVYRTAIDGAFHFAPLCNH